MDDKTKCPVAGGTRMHANRDWWPNQLYLSGLQHNSPLADPMGKEFNYAKEFKSLDLNAVIKDLNALMTDSLQEWCGRPTLDTTVDCSSAWRGTARALTAPPICRRRRLALGTAALRGPPTAGRTTPTSTIRN